MRVGLDIGSTTIKCVVLGEHDELLYSTYERHYSHILEKAQELLRRIDAEQLHGSKALLSISGSAGMGLADSCGVPFVQEVFSTRVAVKRFMPKTDCVIELGGEDAKILFLTNGTEVRMNGSCAGGTGAFIDQMATLLKMSAEEMNKAAEQAQRTYTIASRCGVFAKSDVQPLINQGARTEDIAASIYKAVVNQTIAGLAQGRPIKGNILYLGGPLTFSTVLRKSFDEALNVTGTCPENSLLYVALGAALYADKEFVLTEVAAALDKYAATATYASEPPLFASKEEYEAFHARHMSHSVPRVAFSAHCGPVHIGIDSGSTTVKLVVVDEKSQILYTNYQPNLGNPLPLIREQLLKIYKEHPGLQVASVTTTGYGEELVKNAFRCDYGLVETVAHFTAAKYFMPDVDFIIDIGGQDMKCFKIEDGAISNIFLNEACSSGCGSFLQTFAQALGYDVKEFAALGLFADRPVDLGSRCTVFMNSSVKQAQKDGASIENISAGLSISVVKNALYKVIRARRREDIGEEIVVQGGTFRNDSVLRSFEQELGTQVIRPSIAHLMGAYGAALIAKRHSKGTSTILNEEQVNSFTHSSTGAVCNGCTNHCALTVNVFADGQRLIAGNKCEKPTLRAGAKQEALPDLYKVKNDLLRSYRGRYHHEKKIGIPLVLNMYDLLPFWVEFFHQLGYETLISPQTNKAMYHSAQHSIPSDTACLPAKVVHGHIQWLLDQHVEKIFYPCMTYNVDEQISDNHFNCPLVAYYPEQIDANMVMEGTDFLHPYIVLDDMKNFEKRISEVFAAHDMPHERRLIRKAAEAGMREYRAFHARLHEEHERAVAYARAHHHPIAVVCGRPYHGDPFISHEITKLLTQLGFVVVSEESVPLQEKRAVGVLNQWTYHARLYQAAYYAAAQPDMELIHLVSFGCGIDAITSDEVKAILKQKDRFYTQIKIDEIDNLGAVKIRLRSLKAAIEERKEETA